MRYWIPACAGMTEYFEIPVSINIDIRIPSRGAAANDNTLCRPTFAPTDPASAIPGVYRPRKPLCPETVIPAQAGIQTATLDPRLRGDDEPLSLALTEHQ
jgi:hypothetical protein